MCEDGYTSFGYTSLVCGESWKIRRLIRSNRPASFSSVTLSLTSETDRHHVAAVRKCWLLCSPSCSDVNSSPPRRQPSLYKLMQISKTPFPAAARYTHLFDTSRRRNRIEFITDFPEGGSLPGRLSSPRRMAAPVARVSFISRKLGPSSSFG